MKIWPKILVSTDRYNTVKPRIEAPTKRWRSMTALLQRDGRTADDITPTGNDDDATFLANVNSRSRSLYVVVRPSVICLSVVCMSVAMVALGACVPPRAEKFFSG